MRSRRLPQMSQISRRCDVTGRSPIIVFLLALFGAVAPLHAQIVRGQVVDSVTQVPLAQAVVVLADRDGAELVRTLTDDEGRFLLRVPAAGEFRLRVEAQGYRSSTFPPFTLASSDMKGFMLLVAGIAPPSNPVGAGDVIRQVCPEGMVEPGEGVLVGFVYDESLTPVMDARVVATWPVLGGGVAGLVEGVDAGRQRNIWSTDSGGTYVVCGIPQETEVVFNAGAGALLSDFHTVRFGDGGAYIDETLYPAEQALVRHDFRLLSPTLRTAAVSGVIVDNAMAPMAGVVVEVVETDISTTTDAGGAFSLTALPAGTVRLTARQAGFQPITRELQLTHGDTVTFSPNALVLEASPTELNPVVVEAERPSTRRPLADFWERRERTNGSFITREEFEKRGNPQKATDVLRGMRGIRIVQAPSGKYVVRMNRAMGPRSFESQSGPCSPLFYIDRLYVGKEFDVDNLLPLIDVEAIEAYSGLAVPREFARLGFECGVIVFWTR